ncbi:MAG: hypothetical protein GY778_23775 [bacterium]|nr:hypothetical protein [bacterium]
MAPSTLWVFALFTAIVAVAVLLRRRFGNLYDGLKQGIEQTTGWSMTSIVRGLGIVTLIVWALVYLFFGSDERTGLDQLLKNVFGRKDAPEG